MRRGRLISGLVALVLLVGACGGDGDSDDDASPDRETTSTVEATDGGQSGPDDGQGEAGGADGAAAGADGDTSAAPSTTTGGDGSTGTTTGAGGGSLPAALTAQDICSRLPGDVVASAIGVPSTTATANDSPTPQCSYVYERADGVPTNATVSVLRTEEDLDGRRGAEAFQYVIDINRQAAQSELTQTSVAAGDQALVLSGQNLHFGVVQYGDRIITTILPVGSGDAAAAAALTQATSALLG